MTTLKSEGTNSFKSWLVCLVAAIFFMDEFMRMNMFNSLQQDLNADLLLSTKDYGQLAVCYFYGNVLMLFPAGIMLDRISIRKLLTFVTVACALASLIMANAHTFTEAVISRTITGLGGGFALLSIFKLATRWFSSNKMALVMGVAITLAMLGGLLAQTPFVMLKHLVGWRAIFYGDAVFALISALLMYSIIRDAPSDYKIETIPKFSISEFFQTTFTACKNIHTWVAGFAISLLNLPVFIFGASWGLPYLMQYHALTDVNASLVIAFMFIGMIVGSPLLGAWSDNFSFKGLALQRVKSRSQVMFISALIVIILSAMLIFHGAFGLTALLSIFFLIGFFSSGQVVGYPYISEHNPPALAATAGSISSIIIMSGGIVQPIFASLLEASGDVVYKYHTAIYSAHDYQVALAIVPITCIIVLLLSIIMAKGDKLAN